MSENAASDQATVERVNRIVAAFNANDAATLEQLVSPDFEYCLEGQSPIAGQYRGLSGMRSFMTAIHAAAEGTLRVTPIAVAVDDPWVIMYADVQAERQDRRLDGQNVYLYQFEDGRLRTGRNVPCRQAAWDEFWA